MSTVRIEGILTIDNPDDPMDMPLVEIEYSLPMNIDRVADRIVDGEYPAWIHPYDADGMDEMVDGVVTVADGGATFVPNSH